MTILRHEGTYRHENKNQYLSNSITLVHVAIIPDRKRLEDYDREKRYERTIDGYQCLLPVT